MSDHWWGCPNCEKDLNITTRQGMFFGRGVTYVTVQCVCGYIDSCPGDNATFGNIDDLVRAAVKHLKWIATPLDSREGHGLSETER